MTRCYNCDSAGDHDAGCPDAVNAEVRRATREMQERLVAACERMADAEARALAAEQRAERLQQERAAALSVTTREGLLASEWVLRTGLAEQRAEQAARDLAAANEDAGRLAAYVERHGFHEPTCKATTTMGGHPCSCERGKALDAHRALLGGR